MPVLVTLSEPVTSAIPSVSLSFVISLSHLARLLCRFGQEGVALFAEGDCLLVVMTLCLYNPA